jgi:hypothetical protein
VERFLRKLKVHRRTMQQGPLPGLRMRRRSSHGSSQQMELVVLETQERPAAQAVPAEAGHAAAGIEAASRDQVGVPQLVEVMRARQRLAPSPWPKLYDTYTGY